MSRSPGVLHLEQDLDRLGSSKELLLQRVMVDEYHDFII